MPLFYTQNIDYATDIAKLNQQSEKAPYLLQDAAGTALMYDICYFTGRTAWAGALLLLRKKAIPVSPVTVGFTVSPEASTT